MSIVQIDAITAMKLSLELLLRSEHREGELAHWRLNMLSGIWYTRRVSAMAL